MTVALVCPCLRKVSGDGVLALTLAQQPLEVRHAKGVGLLTLLPTPGP